MATAAFTALIPAVPARSRNEASTERLDGVIPSKETGNPAYDSLPVA
jgi:hypothetical protein